MGSVGAKAMKRTEKETEEEYIDWDARKNQTHKVGRLGLIVRAMRTANRTAAMAGGGSTGEASSSTSNNSFPHNNRARTCRGSLPNNLTGLSERDNAILTREEELSRLVHEEEDFLDINGKLKYDAELENQSVLTDPCVICTAYKRDSIFECRVCGRPYHHSCLIGRGIGLDTNSSKALQSAETEIGWTCPDCESLSDLVPMDAMGDLMTAFDNYDTDGDGVISLSNYIEFEVKKYDIEHNDCMSGSEVRECQTKFEIYDRDDDGMVSWWDFLMVETIKLIKHEPQRQIVQYLKSKEIARLRRFFKMSDKYDIGLLTVGESEQAYREWLRAQGLQDTDEMMRSLERSSNSDESNKMITWERFIWNKALAVITSRPNTHTIKPYVITNEQTAL